MTAVPTGFLENGEDAEAWFDSVYGQGRIGLVSLSSLVGTAGEISVGKWTRLPSLTIDELKQRHVDYDSDKHCFVDVRDLHCPLWCLQTHRIDFESRAPVSLGVVTLALRYRDDPNLEELTPRQMAKRVLDTLARLALPNPTEIWAGRFLEIAWRHQPVGPEALVRWSRLAAIFEHKLKSFSPHPQSTQWSWETTPVGSTVNVRVPGQVQREVVGDMGRGKSFIKYQRRIVSTVWRTSDRSIRTFEEFEKDVLSAPERQIMPVERLSAASRARRSYKDLLLILKEKWPHTITGGKKLVFIGEGVNGTFLIKRRNSRRLIQDPHLRARWLFFAAAALVQFLARERALQALVRLATYVGGWSEALEWHAEVAVIARGNVTAKSAFEATELDRLNYKVRAETPLVDFGVSAGTAARIGLRLHLYPQEAAARASNRKADSRTRSGKATQKDRRDATNQKFLSAIEQGASVPELAKKFEMSLVATKKAVWRAKTESLTGHRPEKTVARKADDVAKKIAELRRICPEQVIFTSHDLNEVGLKIEQLLKDARIPKERHHLLTMDLMFSSLRTCNAIKIKHLFQRAKNFNVPIKMLSSFISDINAFGSPTNFEAFKSWVEEILTKIRQDVVDQQEEHKAKMDLLRKEYEKRRKDLELERGEDFPLRLVYPKCAAQPPLPTEPLRVQNVQQSKRQEEVQGLVSIKTKISDILQWELSKTRGDGQRIYTREQRYDMYCDLVVKLLICKIAPKLIGDELSGYFESRYDFGESEDLDHEWLAADLVHRAIRLVSSNESDLPDD